MSDRPPVPRYAGTIPGIDTMGLLNDVPCEVVKASDYDALNAEWQRVESKLHELEYEIGVYREGDVAYKLLLKERDEALAKLALAEQERDAFRSAANAPRGP